MSNHLETYRKICHGYITPLRNRVHNILEQTNESNISNEKMQSLLKELEELFSNIKECMNAVYRDIL